MLIAAQSGAALGLPAATGLLLAMEAGVPVPFPSDIVLLVLGERAAAGAFPLWLVVLALELVAAAGTTTLYFALRGPGRALLAKVGHRLGLTEARLRRGGRAGAQSAAEAACPLCLALGRISPSAFRLRELEPSG